VHSETPGHIKTKKLKMRLKLPLYQVAGLLEMLWNFAAICADDGGVGRYSNEDIAAHLEYDGDADELIAALVHCRWLDEHPEHRLTVHDWDVWRPHYVVDRIRKREQRKKTTDCPETPRTRPPETGKNNGHVPGSDGQSRETTDSRISKQASKRASKQEQSIDGRLTVEAVERLKPAVDQLFRKAGYSGKSGLIFWKTAALVSAGKIPFDIVESVASRTRSNASDNPPAFFRKTLINECKSRDIDAEPMLGDILFPKSFDRGPPLHGNASLDEVKRIARSLSRTEDA